MADGTSKEAGIDAKAFKAHEHRSWSDAAERYADLTGRITDQAIAPLLDAVDAGPGTRILDVCCGIGSLSDAARRRGSNPTGLDFSEAMVAQARRRHTGLDVREGDAEALPFDDAAFDAVVCCFGARHLPNPERLLAGAYRVLIGGGWLALTDWFPPGHGEGSLFSMVRDAVREHGDPGIVPPIPAPPHDFSDGKTSGRLLEAAGFVDCESVELPIVACFDRAEHVLNLIQGSMARTRLTVESQPPERRRRIQEAILERASRCEREGVIRIPMPAALVRARKP